MEASIDDAVRAVIRSRRAALNLDNSELATRADIPVRTLNRYLHGNSRLTFSTVLSLARALGTTVDAISEDAEKWIAEQGPAGDVK